MVIRATNVYNYGTYNNAAASYASDSISPVANRLYLLSISNAIDSGSPNLPIVSGGGLTWDQVATVVSSDNKKRTTIFRGQSASPGSGVVSVGFSGQTQNACCIAINQFENVKIGNNGADAIGQVVTSAFNASKINNSNGRYRGEFDMGAFAHPCNATFATFNDMHVTDFPQVWAGEGFKLLSNTYSSQTTEFSPINMPRCTVHNFGNGGTTPAVGIGIEIKPATNFIRQFSSMDSYQWRLKYGNAQDSDLNVAVDTTDSPIDANCYGNAATKTLNASNASFTAGQAIMIHQTQGVGAGWWELNQIASYSGGVITTVDDLTMDYTNDSYNTAQVLVIPQHRNGTITGNLFGKAWNGATGGIVIKMFTGTVNVNNVINVAGRGFRGGGNPGADPGNPGESWGGKGIVGYGVDRQVGNVGSGGGAGDRDASNGPWFDAAAGAGGGYGTVGQNGYWVGGANISTPGWGGKTIGRSDMVYIFLGSGGGSGGAKDSNAGAKGENGAGIVIIIARKFVCANGLINLAGDTSYQGTGGEGAGGSGSGGGFLGKCQKAVIGNGKIVISGGGNHQNNYSMGGYGGEGRSHIDTVADVTGSATSLDIRKDNILADNAFLPFL